VTSLLDAPPAAKTAAPAVALLGTITAHGVVVALASIAGASGAAQLQQLMPVTEMVEVELPKPPPPPPATPTVAPREPAMAPRVRPAAPAPPPAAAQAGQILDAKSEAVDFGDNFVTGAGESYAGGKTDSAGTSKQAVTDGAARGAGSAAPAIAVPPDLSQPPKLVTSTLWQCPFPPEADDADVHHAVVALRFEIGADGVMRSVSSSSDPGNGFGREAKRCAQSSRWLAARDRAGRPIPGVALVNVRFDR
jgi:periplasmic protein TonB